MPVRPPAAPPAKDKLHWRTTLLIGLGTLLAYLSTVLLAYGCIDDYGCWAWYQLGWATLDNASHMKDGRPLGALFVWLCYAQLPSLAALWVARAVGLLGCVGLGMSLHRIGLKLGLDNAGAVALATCATLVPAMGAFVGWTIMYYYPPALLGLAWAGYACSSGCDGQPRLSALLRWTLFSYLAAVAGLLLYQPLAGFLIVVPFARVCAGDGRGLRGLVVSLAAVFLAFASYKAAIYPGLHLLNDQWANSPRSALSLSLDHFRVLLADWLPYALAQWVNLFTGANAVIYAAAALLGTLAAAGFAISVTNTRGAHLPRAAALLAALALSAPQVFVMSDIWAFRTWYPLGVLLLFLGWVGLAGLVPERRRRMQLAASLAVAAGAASAVATYWGVVRPSAWQYQVAREQLTEANTGNPAAILCIYGAAGESSPEPSWIRRSGTYSQVAMDFWGAGFVEATALDLWGTGDDAPVLLFTTPTEARAYPGIPVADVVTPLRGAFPEPPAVGGPDGETELPILGKLATDGSWLVHPDLGYLHPAFLGGYYSPALGRVRIWQDAGGQAYLATGDGVPLSIVARDPLEVRDATGRTGHFRQSGGSAELVWETVD